MQDTQTFSYKIFKNYFFTLSPKEQAGFFLWPSIKSHTLTKKEKELLTIIKPSGIILFKRNFLNITQSKNLISEICECVKSENSFFKKKIIVAVDEEGGRVSRLPLNTKTKPVLTFTQNHDKEGLKEQTEMQVRIAKKIGINCILAPVLDIFTEPQNTVIGNRSYGYTPEEVCEYANIVYDILKSNHIFACGKHFPGHGNTKEDSHTHIALNFETKETLQNREWIPFIHFIHKNIPFIMSAHILLLRDDTPATLNYKILTQILRQELGFKGLILSDDLRMKAIEKHYQSKGIHKAYLSYACIDALKAGCDILLSCKSIMDEKTIINAIVKKMKNEIDFFELCCNKAYWQTQLFCSHFDNGLTPKACSGIIKNENSP